MSDAAGHASCQDWKVNIEHELLYQQMLWCPTALDNVNFMSKWNLQAWPSAVCEHPDGLLLFLAIGPLHAQFCHALSLQRSFCSAWVVVVMVVERVIPLHREPCLLNLPPSAQ